MDISIIIPIYNVERYLQECLDSVRDSICDLNAEVLMVDDGSTDSSPLIAEAYSQQHANFVYIRQENSGPSVARNRAIARAKGDYLYFVDSDDLLVKGVLSTMLRAARKSGADITSCDVGRLVGKKVKGSTLQLASFINLDSNTTSVRQHPQLINDCTVSNKLISRPFLQETGMLFPEGRFYEDYSLMVPLYCLAQKVAVVRAPGYLWRVREDEVESRSQSVTSRVNLQDKIAAMAGLIEFFSERPDLDDARYEVEKKILTKDFNAYISALKTMDAKHAEDFVELMGSAIEQLVRPESVSRQSLKIRQRTKYLVDRNLEAVIRLDDFTSTCYASASVTRGGDQLIMAVPSSVFVAPSGDCTNDFIGTTPLSYVDSVQTGKGQIVIEGHLYTPRLSIETPSDQRVDAYLVNDITGEMAKLRCSSCDCHHLTVSKGTMVSQYDGEEHTYNYDGTGFRIVIDMKTISPDDSLLGDNYVILEYENWLKHDYRILRGIGSKKKKLMTGYAISRGRYCGTLRWDVRGTLVFRIVRKAGNRRALLKGHIRSVRAQRRSEREKHRLSRG